MMETEDNANAVEESCSFEDVPKLEHKKMNFIKLKQSDTTLKKHGYKVIFGDDNVGAHFLSVKRSQTPEQLKTAFIQYSTMKIISFQAGITPANSRFDFHGRISLPFLKRITFHIPAPTKISNKTPNIPQEFKRLFSFLKLVEFGSLENITIVCSVYTALVIPCYSAIIPCYEQEDFHPLVDLIRKNKDTLESVIIGPCMNQVYMKLNPKDCDKICEPKGYPQLEAFDGFPKFPILSSWSAMLRPQRHLVRLSLAFTDSDVWKDVCMAIKGSENSLEIIELKAYGTEVIRQSCDLKLKESTILNLKESTILNLKELEGCSKLRKLSLRYFGFNMVGWQFLPPSLKELVLGGHLSQADAEILPSALPNLEEVTVFLKPVYFKGVLVQPLNITLHPTFNFITAATASYEASKQLKEFTVECMEVILDWESLTKWSIIQDDFKLIERSTDEFSLVRKTIQDVAPPVTTDAFQEDANPDEDEPQSFNIFHSCLGILGWRNPPVV